MTDSILTASTVKKCFLGPPELIEGEEGEIFNLDVLKELVTVLKDKPAIKLSSLEIKKGKMKHTPEL